MGENTKDNGTVSRKSEYLRAEHSSLQSAKNAAVSDASSRLGTYLTTVSAIIVALALVSQVSDDVQDFFLFSIVLFPLVLYVGISTVFHLVSLYSAEALYTQAINRIRRFYVDTEPEIVGYLSFPHHDDLESIDRARGLFTDFRFRLLVLPVVQVVLINSFLGAVFITVIVQTTSPLKLLSVLAVAAGTFLILLLAHIRLALSVERRARAETEIRFPRSEGP